MLRGLGDDLAHALARRGRARARLLPGRRPRRRAWPTSCAGCSRTRRTSRSCTSRRAASRSRSCWPRREAVRERAGARAARGSEPRSALTEALATPRRPPPARGAGARRRATRARPTGSSRPTPARRSASWRPRAVPAPRRRRRRSRRRPPPRPAGARRPAAERAEMLVRAADLLRRDRLDLAALEVRECAKPWARGRRRRVRGDRLPRVLRAPGGRARARARSCSRCAASATRCATRPAAWRR